jgi:ribosomal-protein-alanine N-acetyltransferase
VSEHTLGSEITLRRATVDDLSDVIAIERSAFSDPWVPSFFRQLPSNPAALFLLAEETAPRRIVGYIVAWYVVDEAEIANLAVASEARRRGVAARLVDAAIEEGRRRGTRRIYLEVRESNSAARRLYEAHAFEQIGRRKKYYKLPVEDALVMRHEIVQ